MIYFNVNIRNPAWWDRFTNIKWWTGKTPIAHKFWEIQIVKCPELLRIEFEVTTQQDHAGMNIELALLGYQVGCTIYDNRHWDHDNKCWVEYKK